jgi:hypothetical protein
MQVFICPKCHDKIDNGPWGNAVYPRGAGWAYSVWDIKGKPVLPEVDVTQWVVGEAGQTKKHPSGKAVDNDGAVLARLSDHPQDILVPDNDWIERQSLKELARMGREERDAALSEAHFETGDDDANRETPTGMHGEAVQPGEEAEHGQDEAVSKDSGGERPSLHGMDGGPALKWLPPGESDLDRPELGSASAREPGPAHTIDATHTCQIGDSLEKAPALPDVSYEATGLVLRDGLSWERWTEIGATLQQMERSVQWWIGDWLNYGERAYGEKYAQAIETTGMKCQTLMNCAYVASKIDLPARVDSLSWTHHREVAALEPAEQVEWLAKAEAEHMTSRELHEAVRPEKPFHEHVWLAGRMCSHCRAWEETG